MKNHKTISKSELYIILTLDIKNLHYYQGLYQRILTGRKADIEFYEIQEKNGSSYVFEPSFRTQLEGQIVFFSERLEVINQELDKRGLNTLETSIN